jgi:hypothetical protein
MPFTRLRQTWKRLLAWAVAYALVSVTVLASIPFLFGSPEPVVLIYWRVVSASERLSLEREFGLTAATHRNDDTWGYVPARTSPDALRAIVAHPSVADTDGIDRRAFTISDSSPLSPRRGGLLEAPTIARMARLLGYALACFAGIWLLRSGLVSPPLQPGSPFRRALSGRVRTFTETVTTRSRMVRARMRRPIVSSMQVANPAPGASHRLAGVLDLAIALPGVAFFAVTMVLLVAAVLGRGPLWRSEPLTLSEAAALHDDADVLLLIGRGADPNAPGTIRPGMLRRDEIELTPLEAAVGARQERTVEFLLQYGAVVDAPSWTRLMCFAERLEAPAVRAVLERQQPAGTTLDCAGVTLPFDP